MSRVLKFKKADISHVVRFKMADMSHDQDLH